MSGFEEGWLGVKYAKARKQSCEINLLTNNQFAHKSEQCEFILLFMGGCLNS